MALLRYAGLVAGLLAVILLAGCGGSSSPSTSSPTEQATVTATVSQAAVQPTFDIVITGGLQAEWKSGEKGTGASCEIAPTGDAVFFGAYGLISGHTYILETHQDQFRAATFTYPVTGKDTTVPYLQMTTSTTLLVNWNADATGNGSGTVGILGGGGSPLSLSLNLDLTPSGASTKLHLNGTLACPPS